MDRKPQSSLKRWALGAMFIVTVMSFSAGIAPQPARADAFTGTDWLNLVQNTWSAIKSTVLATQGAITAGMAEANHLKEFVLDPAAWVGNNLVLQGVVNSTLNWALTGANGSPTMVSNLQLHLRDIGDTEINSFISQLQGSGAAQSPFFDQIVSSVRRNYFQGTSDDLSADNTFTLNQIPGYQSDFAQNFSHGGLNAFFSSAMHCSNNIYCSFMSVQSQAQQHITAAQSQELTYVNQGNGFAPIRGCSSGASGSATTGTTNTTSGGGASGTVALSTTGGCNGPISTAGSVIAQQVNHMLNLSADRQVQADEISELLSSFIGNALFGSGGLLNINQSGSSGNGGRSALDEQTAQNQTTAQTTIANTTGTFLQSVTRQRDNLVGYIADAQKIHNAAQAAKNALNSCSTLGDHDTLLAQVNAALATYSPEVIATATGQVDTLNQIISSAQASSDPTTALTAQQQYTELLSQIDTTNILQAHDDATTPTTNGGGASQQTLYGDLTDIASQGCLSQLIQ